MPTLSPRSGSFPNRALDALGRVLVASGLLLLAFVAYQLWGTGIQQARSQKTLEKQYSFLYPARQSPGTTVPVVPDRGEVIGRISIPRIKLDTWFVAGARLDELEKGPGLFAGSVLPGQFGNAAVAGHRTSYGAPFGELDKLVPGDPIIYTTAQGEFTYTVTSSEIVDPDRVDVVQTKDETEAVTTLVTCHPKWTSSKRLIVHASLSETHLPMAPTPLATVTWDETDDSSPGWFHDPSRILPSAMWAALLLILWFARRRLAGTGLRRIAVSSVSAVVAVVVLFMLFENLTGLLPANL